MKKVFKLLYTNSLLLALLFLSVSVMAAPAKREFSKTINKHFNMDADGLVKLSNKYGQIDIKTWEQNAVRISVKILVNANSESDAQEQFDLINISFHNSSNEVGASTSIESKKSSWWSWGDNSTDFTINYEVYMPASANMDVMAKYCDVFAVAINGRANMNVKYGNFKLESLGEDSEIVLAYGDGMVSRIRDLDLNLSYGNIQVGEASDLNIDMRYGSVKVDQAGDIISNSRYSDFYFGEIREFRNEGKYDNIEIGTAEELVCETSYTGIKVGELIRRMNLDMAYGSAKVRNIQDGFEEVNISGQYTDFKMYLADDADCTMDLMGSYADLRIPSSRVKTTFDAKDGNSREVKASLGDGSGLLKARLKYGGIVVDQN